MKNVYLLKGKNVDQIREMVKCMDYLNPLEVSIDLFCWYSEDNILVYDADATMYNKITNHGWYEGLLIHGKRQSQLFRYTAYARQLPDFVPVKYNSRYSRTCWEFVPHGDVVNEKVTNIRVLVGGCY
jgi:hypothetical protein